MDKKELWLNDFWEENPTDEEQQEVHEVMTRFNRVVEDLNFLSNIDRICNVLKNSENVRRQYREFVNEWHDFEELSERFCIMRNMLFSENMDWGRLQYVLKC